MGENKANKEEEAAEIERGQRDARVDRDGQPLHKVMSKAVTGKLESKYGV